MAEEKGSTGGGMPVLSWFDGPIKQSINSVFQGLNTGVESLDLFSRFHRAHVEALRSDVQNIKLLGMSSPVKLVDIYSPARVSTTIKRRLYSEEWLKVDQGNSELTRVFRTLLSGVTIRLEVSNGQGKNEGQSGSATAAV